MNVAPNKHGVIPEDQQAILREIGAWLKINGEGIYKTRPFTVFGQGPTNAVMKLHGNMHDKGFTSDDVRYTQKGQNIYAFILKQKEGRTTFSFDALGSDDRIINDAIKKVSIMGYDKAINWIQKNDELVVELPLTSTLKNAIGFKIELEEAPDDILKTK